MTEAIQVHAEYPDVLVVAQLAARLGKEARK